MSDSLKCPICGKPTRVYMGNARKDRLCGTHADMLKAGEIEQCAACGAWHRSDVECECKKNIIKTEKPIEQRKQENGQCIICSNDAPNGSLCKECFFEMLEFKDTFDKNMKAFEFNEYYFNLRSRIYSMKTFDYVKTNCKKLMALAVIQKDIHGSEALTDRIVNDIKDIIEKKKPHEKVNISEETRNKDEQKTELIRTEDGHYVKSTGEETIDNILYGIRVIHCYEKIVPISDDEKTVKADWFIPIHDTRHGIYIEYWGMNTKEYLENKERKRAAYKKYNIPLIEIEKDDIKDKSTLETRIIREINSLSKKYFGIEQFLKLI